MKQVVNFRNISNEIKFDCWLNPKLFNIVILLITNENRKNMTPNSTQFTIIVKVDAFVTNGQVHGK